MEIQGYVIRMTPYKENNSMVNVLTEDGLISFLARGNMSLNSKNAASLALYAESAFELAEGKGGHLSLKTGKVINAHEIFFSDLAIMAGLSLLGELVVKCLDEENSNAFYRHFHQAIRQFENKVDPFTVIADFLAKCLNSCGFGLNVEGCVMCHSQRQIVAFSYLDGGFICKNCYDDRKHANPGKAYLQTVRYLFMEKREETVLKRLPFKESMQIIEELVRFLEEQLGIRIKGTDLFFKVMR